MATTARAGKLFKTGKKQVFLPKDTVCLLRTRDKTPPQFAKFKVPLTFNKLDLRDYLLHAYNVATLRVRSQVYQPTVRTHEITGKVYKPRALKTMTVELAKPFVWPARAEDKAPWNPETLERRHEVISRQQSFQKEAQRRGTFPMRSQQPEPPGRAAMREEAKRLLEEGGWSNKGVEPENVSLSPREKRAEVRAEIAEMKKNKALAESKELQATEKKE